MLLNNKCPLIILDFDGVILESVEVKTEAFRRLFSFAPGHVEEIVNFHRENGVCQDLKSSDISTEMC